MSWDVGGTTGSAAGWGDPLPSSSTSQAGRDSWDSQGNPSGATPPGGSTAITAAPMLVLAAGLVLALAGITVGLTTESATLGVVGWALAGPMAVGAFGIFLVSDVRRRAQPMYAESSVADWARRSLVLLATAGVALNAWIIADALARGTWT